MKIAKKLAQKAANNWDMPGVPVNVINAGISLI